MQIYCKKYKLQIIFTFFDIKDENFVVFAIKNYICTYQIQYIMAFQLKRIMTERGVNITELSKLTGITNANISNMIHGKTSPNLDTIERIANALGVDSWELLRDVEEESRDVIICPQCGSKFKLLK